mmetsp:Transcript_21308/g.64921  ORF Transcript_21308/g.64921 Transcript_21308/m.64921 type:complete len:91 (-) Transcript_21308:311-583(-)
MTDLIAVPSWGERNYWRFVMGATIGVTYPLLMVPLLGLKVYWTLGLLDPHYHNYNLAATLGSLACWCLFFTAAIWRRWSSARRIGGKQHK